MDPLTTKGGGNDVDVEKVNESSNNRAVHNFVGKHRMTAAIALLDQQIQFLQEEIEELETLGGSSIVCKETKGPTEVAWERWFQGARSSKNRKKWI